MIDPKVRRELEAGSSLILGTVSPDDQPRASRAWGLRIVDGEPTTVRLLIDRLDPIVVENLAPGRFLSITGCTIDTLASVQLKCRSLGVVELDELDRAEGMRQRDAFISEVARIDGIPREILEAWVRQPTAVCLAEVVQMFDQTPGPQAGAVMRF